MAKPISATDSSFQLVALSQQIQETLSISIVPAELLAGIFDFAVFSNQSGDAQTLVDIRVVCSFWKIITDDEVLEVFWEKTKKLPHFNQIPFVFTEIEQVHNAPGNAPVQLSALRRFNHLSRTLDAPRLLFLSSDYAKHIEGSFDDSLEVLWANVQGQIDFGDAPIPANANAIRKWLNDPANADSIQLITTLDLSGLDLLFLPPEIGLFTQLKSLSLENNQLMVLPDEIGLLGKLDYLCLRDNQLHTLPDTINQLSSLEWLSLENNRLNKLPNSIGLLPKLKCLYLSNNRLNALPDTIAHLKSLRVLYLENNPLKPLSAAMALLDNLSELFVKW